MPISPEFTPSIARKMFSYNPATGELTYKQRQIHMFLSAVTRSVEQADHSCRTWNASHVGKLAGSLDTARTRRIRIGKYAKSTVKAANLIWFMVYNEWPPSYGPYAIVHANGDNSDDRLSNLMTRQQYQLQGGPTTFIDPGPLSATDVPARPPKKFYTLLQDYKQQRKVVQPDKVTGPPTIVNRKHRHQASSKALHCLQQMVELYPPFQDTKHYRTEMRKWKRWYAHQRFTLPNKEVTS